jgi:hypothetical protein
MGERIHIHCGGHIHAKGFGGLVQAVSDVVVLETHVEITPRVHMRVAVGYHFIAVQKHPIHVFMDSGIVSLVHFHSQVHSLVIGDVLEHITHSFHDVIRTTCPLIDDGSLQEAQR